MLKTTNKVITISENQVNDAVNTLTLAFEKDPFHRYVFENHLKHYQTLEQILFKYLSIVKFKHSQDILGVTRDNKLMGIANIEAPEYQASFWKSYISPDVSSLLLQMILVSGLVPAYRLIKYSQLIEAKKPKEPHFYLVALGVNPQGHGQGYGKSLLNHLHELSEHHPTSVGVALDTANPDNVPLYEHFGYRVVSKETFGKVNLWCMFRANKNNPLLSEKEKW